MLQAAMGRTAYLAWRKSLRDLPPSCATSDGRKFPLDARSEREERLNLLAGAA
jgi:hypothetical protein